MRCTFCAYGAPDERTAHLGQKAGRVEIPPPTLERMREALQRGDRPDGDPPHLPRRRLAHRRERRKASASCNWRASSSRRTRAHPGRARIRRAARRLIEQFHAEQLVQHVCFNLEMWSEPLFAKVCPGKNRYVGYAPLDRGARDRGAPLGPRQRLLGDGRRHRARARARPRMGRGRAHRARGRRRPLQPRHHSDLLARLAGRRPRNDPTSMRASAAISRR